ncbi:hypothetical protein M9435_005261 [Picochlorum sp. BPE23]|nr:hypothetical protein M9435_005261 [Picochlorum sp. BPE23]
MDVNVFGLSSLREEKKKETKKKDPDKVKKLQDYLSAQYGSNQGDEKKRKKKKKSKKKLVAGSVAIVDEDIDFAARDAKNDVNAGAMEDDDGPVVANADEFERRQLQELRERQLLLDQGDGHRGEGGGGGGGESSEDDMSPPRRRASGRHDSDVEDSDDGDVSPPRRRASGRHDSDVEDSDDGDVSPPRRRGSGRHDSDLEDSDDQSDASPPRRPQGSISSGDVSPPRRQQQQSEDAVRMSDGTLAGMVSGRELRKEMEEKRAREQKRLEKLGDAVTGRGARTVYRTEDGQAISKEEYEEAMRRKQSQENKYLEGSEIPWGRGLQQSHGGRAEGLHESTRAAASRWDDPMAHILGTKQRPDLKTDTSLLDRFAKDLKKAGFNVPLDIPKHSWLNRNMGPPVNRFGIRPGRHWDGVDRSNGFEKDLFRRKAELRQREQMAHYMAQEDM